MSNNKKSLLHFAATASLINDTEIHSPPLRQCAEVFDLQPNLPLAEAID